MTGTFWVGARAGLSFTPGVFVLSASFGAVAQPVMGLVAPILMSALQFAGSSQLAAAAVLAADGSAAAAIAAGMMLNARFLPMSVAAAPALRGGTEAFSGGSLAVDARAVGVDVPSWPWPCEPRCWWSS